MRAMRVVLAVFVCFLALGLTEAVERKSLHNLRNRIQAAVSVEGRDDMDNAKSLFDTRVKPTITARFATLTPKSDAVEERTIYTGLASSILTHIGPLLGPNIDISKGESAFAQLTDAQLELASKIAYLFRHELRLETRKHMASRGACAAFLQWLAQVRDFFVYGNKDGPTYASLVDKATKANPGAKATTTNVLPREISSKILISSTTTNEKVNKMLGVNPTGAAPSALPQDVVDTPVTAADLSQNPIVTKLAADSKLPTPQGNDKAAPPCSRPDRVLARAYVSTLVGPATKENIDNVLADLRVQFDSDPVEELPSPNANQAPSASPSAPSPTAPKGKKP